MSESQNRTAKDQFMLRLPDGMRERIKAAADAASRSMNAEIVATLEDAYPPPFSSQETIKMIKASLAMFSEDRGGLAPGTAEKNRQFLLWVLKKMLSESDPEKRLKEIEVSDIDVSEVTINRYMAWQNGIASALSDVAMETEAKKASAIARERQKGKADADGA